MNQQQITIDVLLEKYAKGNEQSAEDIFKRVAKGIAAVEKDTHAQEYWEAMFYENMRHGAVGAGRIMSAAGTDVDATLVNCFTQPVGDSITGLDKDNYIGIYDALTESAETLRRGGGVGYDFSYIRPKNSQVGKVGAMASGPCSYMNIFNSSCETIESAGQRRGAQMGSLRIDHPDIEEFIKAKRTPGRWNNFNVSVFVNDIFMHAKNNNQDIELVHKAKPSQMLLDTGVYQKEDGNWVYKKVNARDLWELIMKSNYDFAEPGILFADNINNDNNLNYCEYIRTTNPCVTADTWVMTDEGAYQVNDLIGKPFNAIVNGNVYKTLSKGFFSNGIKDVYRLVTEEGYELRLTSDHKLLKVSKQTRNVFETEWIAAKDLKQNDKIVLNNHVSFKGWTGQGTEQEGYLVGLLIGDGWLDEKKATISVWETKVINGTRGVMLAAEDAAFSLPHNENFNGFQQRILSEKSSRMSSVAILKLANDMGVVKGNKTITPEIEKASSVFNIGLLRGLFDTDGSVQGNQEKGVSLRLSQSNLKMLLGVQRILLRFGIVSKIYANRRNAEKRLLPDGQGGKKFYNCKANHELIISKQNLFTYNDKIGFNDSENARKIKEALKNYSRTPNKEYFTTTVFALIKDTTEEVFDVTVDIVHAFDANGIMAHNCGEQPLPDYGCCDLGPIILPKFVSNPFTAQSRFLFDEFKEAIATHVRFLDNVLDATLWPLEKQRIESSSKRRVGLGFTGLGNMLSMLNLAYNSSEGLLFAGDVVRTMRDTAYRSSVELAKERGAFPLFNAELYLKDGSFASRLPDDIKNDIRQYGIRNSHLLSVAPVGTVSLAFADNASNGIEPPYSLAYTRKKRMVDGSKQEYAVIDHSLRVYLSTLEKKYADILLDAICNYQDTFEYNEISIKVKDALPKSIVTALELTPTEHLAMMKVVQPFIDSSISKTVNIPEDYLFDDFKTVYDQAWVGKLKGVATYRPNNILGSVLSVEKPKTEVISNVTCNDVDPNSIIILKRPLGKLQSISDKIQYYGDHGDYTFYVSVSFMKVNGVRAGKEITVNRPIEIFITVSPSSVPLEWVTVYSRTMSLIARTNLALFVKALQDNRSISSGKQIRYDWYVKEDGSKVPRHHGSDVAVISYAIQQILIEHNILDNDGNIEMTEVIKEVVIIPKKALVKPEVKHVHGKTCPECGTNALIKMDGCEKCTACGYIGHCG